MRLGVRDEGLLFILHPLFLPLPARDAAEVDDAFGRPAAAVKRDQALSTHLERVELRLIAHAGCHSLATPLNPPRHRVGPNVGLTARVQLPMPTKAPFC